LGKGEFSADLFVGKYHSCYRGDYNRYCRDEEKEEKRRYTQRIKTEKASLRMPLFLPLNA
jgi:hypothetical protein